jgi:predicted methyltransferase/L-amino acid N-acyltransferase YncA
MEAVSRTDGLAEVAESVAAAVGLQEGAPGVRRILSAIHRLSPAPAREVSRRVGIAVPLVTAVTGELRSRGVLTTDRPARLTAYGISLLGSPPTDHPSPPPTHLPDPLHGGGITLRPAVADRLADLAARMPRVDLALDQSHCTVETKLRRIALLRELDILPAESVLILGDDDLMSLSLLAAGAALGRPLARRIAVVDVSPELLDFIGSELDGATVELHRHDLREPLPESLRGRFDVAMTDPPYTTEGARLFLSRVVEGLRPGPGHSVAFSFGPKGPDDALEVQRVLTELGLAVQATYRGFNEYLGSGLLGGTSHLHWLVTTAATATAVPGRYPGPLYTAELRGTRSRVRLAETRDLPALADFEVRIAEVSFGEDAVTDPEVHHAKLAKALGRDRDGMLVAEDEHGRVVGWLWLAVNTNFLTGQRYANFRSLAVAPDAAPRTAESLLDRALSYARHQGVTEVVGRVHVDNAPMRVLYRKYGFRPAHLTMRWKAGGGRD